MITLDFATLMRNQVTAIRAVANSLQDFAIGSILRAMVESNSTVGIWLQNLILELLAKTRASTSTGEDLDSWVADFGVTRAAATSAVGYVTFSRFTATTAASIPVGTTIETADGGWSYAVVADSDDVNYVLAGDVYTLQVGVSSLTVPVVATVPGTGGNAVVGAINTITKTVVGIDTVTNKFAFTSGVDAESDSALRTRFIAYIASLSKATKTAVGFAITNVRSNLTYSIMENVEYNGDAKPGNFVVVIDDGTGYPSSDLQNSVANAVDMVRPLASTFGVFPPVVVTVNVTLTVAVAAGYDAPTVKSAVDLATSTYINSLAMGADLPYTVLFTVAYGAHEAVTNVTNASVNGGTADITTTSLQVIKTGTITVN